MDANNYEQFFINKSDLEGVYDLLQENIHVTSHFYKGRVIGVELPIFVQLEIVHTEPGLKGDTATGGTKAAKVETGAIIQVPLHLSEGDKIKIDTRTRKYVERVK